MWPYFLITSVSSSVIVSILPPSFFLGLFIHFVSSSSANTFFFLAFRCSSSRLNLWRFVPTASCFLSGPLLLSSSFTLFSFLLVSFFHALCAAAFLRDVCRSRAETKLCHLPRVTHVLPLRSPRLSVLIADARLSRRRLSSLEFCCSVSCPCTRDFVWIITHLDLRLDSKYCRVTFFNGAICAGA